MGVSPPRGRLWCSSFVQRQDLWEWVSGFNTNYSSFIQVIRSINGLIHSVVWLQNNAFFLGPRYTLPLIFIQVGPVDSRKSCKQTDKQAENAIISVVSENMKTNHNCCVSCDESYCFNLCTDIYHVHTNLYNLCNCPLQFFLTFLQAQHSPHYLLILHSHI